LLDFKANYAEIASEITEDLFLAGGNPDNANDGTNKTGSY
jgi:hypothetical protein